MLDHFCGSIKHPQEPHRTFVVRDNRKRLSEDSHQRTEEKVKSTRRGAHFDQAVFISPTGAFYTVRKVCLLPTVAIVDIAISRLSGAILTLSDYLFTNS
jgi:hypothetical protein